MTYCGNNQIYAFGGFDQYTDEVYNHVLRLDLISHQWTLVDNYGDIPGVRMGRSQIRMNSIALLIYLQVILLHSTKAINYLYLEAKMNTVPTSLISLSSTSKPHTGHNQMYQDLSRKEELDTPLFYTRINCSSLVVLVVKTIMFSMIFAISI